MKKIFLFLATALMCVSCFEKLEFGAGWKPGGDPDPDPETPQLEFKINTFPDGGEVVKSTVFEAGKDNHIYYRIPAMVETKGGKILAFCEARNTKADFYEGHEDQFQGIPVYQQGSSKDSGDIDLVMKVSEDGGATWGGMVTLFDDGNNTCGNPSPVLDHATGRVWLFWCWQKNGSQTSTFFPSILDGHTRRVLYTYSDDEGQTWAPFVDATPELKDRDWTWYATGPCHATQVFTGSYKGRLIIPCNHRDAANKHNYSHCCYSDDFGKTWKLGGTTAVGGNESCIVELSDGSVMTSMRIAGDDMEEGVNANCRAFSVSKDGGASWGTFDRVESLIDPGCQGSIFNYHNQGKPTSTLLLSNCHHSTTRKAMAISVSKDNGKTWTTPYSVYDSRSAYSDVFVLSDGSVCVLYENGYGKYGTINPNELISFQRLPASIAATKLNLK